MPMPPAPASDDSTVPVTIVGDGQMGLVLARLLAEKNAPCVLSGPFPDEVERLARERRSPRLPDFTLPDSIRVEPIAARALHGAALVVNAIPTQFIRAVWVPLASSLPREAVVMSVAKGFERGSHRLPCDILAESLRTPTNATPPMVALTGPTIAAELARRLPAAMLAASHHAEAAHLVQRVFTTPWLRIYTHDDPVGAEVAGALKNVIALAAGMIDGLGLGFNAKSALLARGLAEMVRLGVALGAKTETFFGIAGVGDLATTCFSPEGRNRACGEAIGRGATLNEHLARTRSVVEGVETARSVADLARDRGVDMPITDAVCRILFDGLPPLDAIHELMTREAKSERIG